MSTCGVLVFLLVFRPGLFCVVITPVFRCRSQVLEGIQQAALRPLVVASCAADFCGFRLVRVHCNSRPAKWEVFCETLAAARSGISASQHQGSCESPVILEVFPHLS